MSACTAVTKIPQATGGSKADGVVNLSYQASQFEQVTVDWFEGDKEALRRCKSWGYKEVEPFGGMTSSCSQYGGLGGGCAVMTYNKSYQCIK